LTDEIISINPATLEVIGRTPVTPDAKVREAVAAARAAQPAWARVRVKDRAACLLDARDWARVPVKDRAACLLDARDALIEHLEEIAHTITIDNGKPLTESVSAELYPVAELLWTFAHAAERLLRDESLPIGPLRF
jgi:acyl-CoA reductase-like NAD-dependent aldehyde dehydrogenase